MGMMSDMEHEDYGPKRRAAEKAIGQTRDFLAEQAMDPTTWLSPAGKGLGVGAKVARGLFAATLAGKADDANAMFFGGTYIKDAIKHVENLVKLGASKEEIFKRTGFFKAPNGEWRHYKADKGVVGPKGRLGFADAAGTTKDFLVHPSLYKYDPRLAEAPVVTKPVAEMNGYGGLYQPDTRNISLSAGLHLKDKFSVLMHELQHDVQNLGNVEGGTNMSVQSNYWNTPKANKAGQSLQQLKKLFEQKYGYNFDTITQFTTPEWEKLPKEVQEAGSRLNDIDMAFKVFQSKARQQAPYFKYMNNSGEVEARITPQLVGRDLTQEQNGLYDLYDLYGKEITAPNYYENFQFTFD